MKTVTGRIVSSTPVSLSKAAKIISKFSETDDNGASQAVRAYLRRSATSFNELKKLHRELEAPSKHKHKKVKSEPAVEAAEEPSQEPVQLSEDGERKKRKKKRNKEIEGANSGDYRGGLILDDKEKLSEETKHKREERTGDETVAGESNSIQLKHKKDTEIDEKENGSTQKPIVGFTEEQSEGKKHKKEGRIGDEIGAGESNGSQLKHKKKRKDAEVEEKEDGSSQKPIVGFTEEQNEGKKHKKEKKNWAQVDGGEDGGEVETKEGKKKRKIKELEEEKENGYEPTPDLKQCEKKKKHNKKDKGADQDHVMEDGVKTDIKEGKEEKGAEIDGDKGNDSSEMQHEKKKKKKGRKAEAES